MKALQFDRIINALFKYIERKIPEVSQTYSKLNKTSENR